MTSPLLWYVARATGLTAMVLLSGTMALGLLTATRVSNRFWPRFATQELHRQVSLTTLVFLSGHVLSSVLDTYVHIGLAAVVVPFASPYKRAWVGVGAIALDLLLAVAASSLLRARMSARSWRGLHWLVYLCWPMSLLHGFAIGTDMKLPWVDLLTLGCVGAVGAVGALRLLRRAAQRRHVGALPAVAARPRGVPVKHEASC